MADITMPPMTMEQFGQRLFRAWETHRDDRKAAEERWLQNLRQFRGIYDPEVLKQIPADRSKAYPKLTRWKVIGTVARLMQMLFPQTEKNWGLKPSPLPNLSIEQLQQVLDELVAATAQKQQIQPAQVELKDEDIEKAILEFAKGKAERMSVKLDDDLQEMEYITLARRVVFSAVLYNVGVLKGPMHQKYRVRTWQKNPFTGKYTAHEADKLKPLLEFLPVWNWYPDMSAVDLTKQDGTFERHVMTRREVEALGERPDFQREAVQEWLRTHMNGNHVPEHWESELRREKKSDRQTTSEDQRKYVVLSYWGDVTGHELKAAGVSIPDSDVGKTFHGDVWMIEKTIIKAKVAMLADEARRHHEFVFEEDDLSLLGNGQCDTLRDSQLSICEAARMSLDEASIGGENLEVNKDLLAPGVVVERRSYKIWEREGEGATAQIPAVKTVGMKSRLPDLMNMVQMFLEFANNESGLPPPSIGDVSQGGSEALRTQQNASMFLGAASLPLRDTVRNYDRFTTSVMTALVKWNMKFDPNASRDGDFDVIARGSTSLIAKEVLAQSLDLFASTLTDEERAHINTRKLLEARAKARDIPIDDLFEDEDKVEERLRQAANKQQEMADVQMQEVASKIRKQLAEALKAAAQARQADASVEIDVLDLLMEVLNGGSEAGKARSSEGAVRAAA